MKFRNAAKLIIIFIVITIVMIANSCKNPTSPEEKPEPGRRDYVWTADTLKVAPDIVNLNRMWANNENDIWAVGDATPHNLGVWHYDGQSWEPFEVDIRMFPLSIWGFNKDAIFIGDMYGKIWKYYPPYSKWMLSMDTKVEGYDNTIIENISGSSPNNVYAVGAAYDFDGKRYIGVIYHFDGNNWTRVNIPDTKVSFIDIKYSEKIDLIFFIAVIFNEGYQTFELYTYDGRTLKSIFSTTIGMGIWSFNGDIIMSTGQKIYKYINGAMQVWKDFTNTRYVGGFYARSESDFFGVGYGGIVHYNGADFETIYPTNLVEMFTAIFKEDLFFLMNDWDNNKSIIVHGKLK